MPFSARLWHCPEAVSPAVSSIVAISLERLLPGGSQVVLQAGGQGGEGALAGALLDRFR